MARVIVCDICKKATNRIVFKMFLSPKNGTKGSGDHSHYTGYVEVGECCAAKETERVTWRKRKKEPWKKNKGGKKPANA